MSTPAAKRRRVDAANVTLRKPFHSPLIRRRPDDDGSGSSGPSKTPPKPNADIATTGEDIYSPSSPSVASANRPSRSLGALRQTSLQRPSSSVSSSSSSPLKFKTPIQRNRGVGVAGGRGGVKTTKVSTTENAAAAAAAAAASDDNDDGGAAEDPGGALLALVKAHRHTAQDAVLKDLDRKLETVRQAKRIEVASDRERPGEAVDQALRDLVSKWKGASRMAAEELFEIVRERVANSGGPKAWKEMRQRQMEFYQEWDQEEAMQRKSLMDEEGNSKFHEELEGDDDDGRAEAEALEAEAQAKEEEEEQSEPEFNMAQMLQSLNVDTALLGYDEVEEKWID